MCVGPCADEERLQPVVVQLGAQLLALRNRVVHVLEVLLVCLMHFGAPLVAELGAPLTVVLAHVCVVELTADGLVLSAGGGEVTHRDVELIHGVVGLLGYDDVQAGDAISSDEGASSDADHDEEQGEGDSEGQDSSENVFHLSRSLSFRAFFGVWG